MQPIVDRAISRVASARPGVRSGTDLRGESPSDPIQRERSCMAVSLPTAPTGSRNGMGSGVCKTWGGFGVAGPGARAPTCGEAGEVGREGYGKCSLSALPA